jgi:hypothetical protein
VRRYQHQHQPRHSEYESLFCFFQIVDIPFPVPVPAACQPLIPADNVDSQRENDIADGGSPRDALTPVRLSYKYQE